MERKGRKKWGGRGGGGENQGKCEKRERRPGKSAAYSGPKKGKGGGVHVKKVRVGVCRAVEKNLKKYGTKAPLRCVTEQKKKAENRTGGGGVPHRGAPGGEGNASKLRQGDPAITLFTCLPDEHENKLNNNPPETAQEPRRVKVKSNTKESRHSVSTSGRAVTSQSTGSLRPEDWSREKSQRSSRVLRRQSLPKKE